MIDLFNLKAFVVKEQSLPNCSSLTISRYQCSLSSFIDCNLTEFWIENENFRSEKRGKIDFINSFALKTLIIGDNCFDSFVVLDIRIFPWLCFIIDFAALEEMIVGTNSFKTTEYLNLNCNRHTFL